MNSNNISSPTAAEIADLFRNDDPIATWDKATHIVQRMNPCYDFTLVHSVYQDVLRMFSGDYPGYSPIRTPYHDLSHTLGAFMCAVRLMHGVHLSGDRLRDDEITLILLAVMMHDVGYAQRKGEEGGSGAQLTQVHVQRGIEFMHNYFTERGLDVDMAAMEVMILGTEHPRPFAQIEFRDERVRMLARIVATADITGQMADRIYLEKLLFLYLEFREAKFGSYQSMFQLLRQTDRFYKTTCEKLDGALGGIYQKLKFHFRDTMGVDNNFYLESIEKNMAYLSQVIARDEVEFFAMLRRDGIVEKSRSLT